MSTKTAVANRETVKHPQEEEPVGQVVDKLVTPRRLFKGVARHILAVRRVRKLEAENLALQADNQRLVHENTHDDLTGLYTKKAWKDIVDERIKAKRPFGVIFIDMDAFKAVNDNLSHEKGDEVLKDYGEHMRSSYRRKGEAVSHERYFGRSDNDELQIGRYGGDEFGIIVDLGDRELPDGLTVEQRMEAALAYNQQMTEGFVESQDEEVKALGYNISQGGAICDPSRPITPTEIISQADHAMYQVKAANGRPAR